MIDQGVNPIERPAAGTAIKNTPCVVSIVIKALNEERRIAKAIETALVAVSKVGGEVILADSCSTDRTVEIAMDYPVKIVQLQHSVERCCGVGPQLGFQHASGEFIYILDGDMELLPEFLPVAIALMRSEPGLAGIGGKVIEMNMASLEYIARTERAAHHMSPGEVDRLDMGGLYRSSAIIEVGYLSDRNLHSYEEFDLAVRLRARGWLLKRIASESVRHHGHDAPPYYLLIRRWRSKYILGTGELLKAAVGKTEFKLVWSGLKELRIYLAVMVGWLIIILLACTPIDAAVKFAIITVFVVAPIALMAARKKSLSKACFSVVSWNFNAAGLTRGLLERRRQPGEPIASIVIKDPANL